MLEGGTGLMKLQQEVSSCEYGDVHVMWELLRRSEIEVGESPKRSKKRRLTKCFQCSRSSPFHRRCFSWTWALLFLSGFQSVLYYYFSPPPLPPSPPPLSLSLYIPGWKGVFSTYRSKPRFKTRKEIRRDWFYKIAHIIFPLFLYTNYLYIAAACQVTVFSISYFVINKYVYFGICVFCCPLKHAASAMFYLFDVFTKICRGKGTWFIYGLAFGWCWLSLWFFYFVFHMLILKFQIKY